MCLHEWDIKIRFEKLDLLSDDLCVARPLYANTARKTAHLVVSQRHISMVACCGAPG